MSGFVHHCAWRFVQRMTSYAAFLLKIVHPCLALRRRRQASVALSCFSASQVTPLENMMDDSVLKQAVAVQWPAA
jgi:hypothetical protein